MFRIPGASRSPRRGTSKSRLPDLETPVDGSTLKVRRQTRADSSKVAGALSGDTFEVSYFEAHFEIRKRRVPWRAECIHSEAASIQKY